jgi:tetratricopeptide (TPR) repeat protein
MGFGKKTDFESGRTLDLDKTYKYIIKPAVTAAGLECVRADEIPHSGVIDVPMYEKLLTADVVIADLSTSNKNAYYELGVRHALRPHTTIVICEDGAKSFPFDVNHVLIRQYHHMGEDIGFGEVERFRADLTQAIRDILNQSPRRKDSPVYTFLSELTPPALAAAMQGVAEEVAKAAPVIEAAAQAEGMVYSEMMEQADEAQREGDFVTAKALLSRLRKKLKEAARKAAEEAARNGVKDVVERPEDPYLIQRLALVTYKSKQPSPQVALEEARGLLQTLDPATSNDTETLGLWGAVHKRLWELTGDHAHLDEAVRGYERGFHLRNDYYNGINLAYLLNDRAASSCRRAESAASPEEATQLRAGAIACYVHAGEIRREVLGICEKVSEAEKPSGDNKYWVLATIAEAYLGIGDEEKAEQKLQEAFAVASAQWMKDSTQEQMDKLRKLLAVSPLRFLKADGG